MQRSLKQAMLCLVAPGCSKGHFGLEEAAGADSVSVVSPDAFAVAMGCALDASGAMGACRESETTVAWDRGASGCRRAGLRWGDAQPPPKVTATVRYLNGLVVMRIGLDT